MTRSDSETFWVDVAPIAASDALAEHDVNRRAATRWQITELGPWLALFRIPAVPEHEDE